MWRRIEVRNYRSFEFARADLPPFVMVVGQNGSGKSNFADALVFARDIGLDASLAVARRGGITSVRRWGRTKPYDVLVDIRASQSKEGLDKDYVRHQFSIRSGQEGKWTFNRELVEVFVKGRRNYSISRDGDEIETSDKSLVIPPLPGTTSVALFARQLGAIHKNLGLTRVRRFRLNPDEMRRPQLPTEAARLDETGANITTALRASEHFARTVVEVMRRLIPGLQTIVADPIGRYLVLKFTQAQAEGQMATFTADEVSEGALRALGIVVAANQMSRDELLIIEEPEVGIHSGAANLLFDVLKSASEKGAVLITTHSVDLLDAAKEEEILVCEYGQGTSHIGPLSLAQKEVVRKGLFSLAELIRTEPLRIEGSESSAVPKPDQA